MSNVTMSAHDVLPLSNNEDVYIEKPIIFEHFPPGLLFEVNNSKCPECGQSLEDEHVCKSSELRH